MMRSYSKKRGSDYKNDSSKVPTWVDANHIEPSWIESALNIPWCDSCTAIDISNETNKSEGDAKNGATLRLLLVTKDNKDTTQVEEQTMIVKQVLKEYDGSIQAIGSCSRSSFL